MSPSPFSEFIADQIDEIVYLYEGKYTKRDVAKKIDSALHELEKSNTEVRSILLRLHSARAAMNEKSTVSILDEIDGLFREENTN